MLGSEREVTGKEMQQIGPGASRTEETGGRNLEKAGSGLPGERAFPKEGFLCMNKLPNSHLVPEQ